MIHYVHYSYNTGLKKNLPVKIKGDSYNFDTTESEYGNQIALSPTNFKTEGIIYALITNLMH